MRLLMCIILMCLPGAVPGASADPAQGERSAVSAIEAMIERAEPGATIELPAGVYEGNLVIRKGVVLDGMGHTVIDGLGDGSVVTIAAEGVTLRRMVVRNSGSDVTGEPSGVQVLAAGATIEHCTIEDTLFGIDLREAGEAMIRDNNIVGKEMDAGRRGDGIRLWWSHNSVIERNTVRRSRDMVFWYSENLRIRENSVTDCRYGLHFMYSHDTILENNDLWDNSVGVYLMYSNAITLEKNNIVNNRGSSGYGIGLKDCDGIIVRKNALLANRVGLYIDNSPSSIDSVGIVEGNKFAFNEVGLLATPNTHDNVFTLNSFVENEEQVTVHGGGQLKLNAFSKDGRGNFWSSYTGFDRDGDGVGDFPHQPRSLFRTLLAREPNLRIFMHSPAQQAVELTVRAFPELSPEPMFVDPSPLTDLPSFEAVGQPHVSRTLNMSLVSAGLLLAGGLGIGVIARPGDEMAKNRTTNRAADSSERAAA